MTLPCGVEEHSDWYDNFVFTNTARAATLPFVFSNSVAVLMQRSMEAVALLNLLDKRWYSNHQERQCLAMRDLQVQWLSTAYTEQRSHQGKPTSLELLEKSLIQDSPAMFSLPFLIFLLRILICFSKATTAETGIWAYTVCKRRRFAVGFLIVVALVLVLAALNKETLFRVTSS